MDFVQIDHTKLDVIVVDEQQRLPIGRPWITLAIDVYSRMVLGFYISLDPPGAIRTGQCIAHAALPKETWLAKRGIVGSWPCRGIPALIHLDNSKIDFFKLDAALESVPMRPCSVKPCSIVTLG